MEVNMIETSIILIAFGSVLVALAEHIRRIPKIGGDRR